MKLVQPLWRSGCRIMAPPLALRAPVRYKSSGAAPAPATCRTGRPWTDALRVACVKRMRIANGERAEASEWMGGGGASLTHGTLMSRIKSYP